MAKYEYAGHPSSRRTYYCKITQNLRQRVIDNALISSYPSMPKPFSSFTLSPHLPPNIRCRIWRHALPGPRIVQLRKIHSNHSAMLLQSITDNLLQVSTESRQRDSTRSLCQKSHNEANDLANSVDQIRMGHCSYQRSGFQSWLRWLVDNWGSSDGNTNTRGRGITVEQLFMSRAVSCRLWRL